MTTTHNYAPRSGFDTSGSSGLYHNARPRFPAEALQAILESAQNGDNSSGLKLLEIGSGTGISTEGLLRQAAAMNLPISKFLAIEPSEGMRVGWKQEIQDKVVPELQQKQSNGKALLGEIECIDGTFEKLNAGHGWDALMIAQAFHWCSDQEASLSAIASALRSGGHLALIWNLEDRNTKASWVGALRDLYEKYEDGTPQYRHGYWKTMYDTAALKEYFEVVEPQHYTRTIPTTVQGVIDRVLSKSFITVLRQDKQDSLVKKIRDLFESKSDEELGRTWIDKEQGVFEYPYTTGEYNRSRQGPHVAKLSHLCPLASPALYCRPLPVQAKVDRPMASR